MIAQKEAARELIRRISGEAEKQLAKEMAVRIGGRKETNGNG